MRNRRLILCISVLFTILAAGQDSNPSPTLGHITSQEIVARMTANNRKRQEQLQSYTGQREYHLLYTGFPGRREADLIVQVQYRAPDNKEFTVISQSGSRWVGKKGGKKRIAIKKKNGEQTK